MFTSTAGGASNRKRSNPEDCHADPKRPRITPSPTNPPTDPAPGQQGGRRGISLRIYRDAQSTQNPQRLQTRPRPQQPSAAATPDDGASSSRRQGARPVPGVRFNVLTPDPAPEIPTTLPEGLPVGNGTGNISLRYEDSGDAGFQISLDVALNEETRNDVTTTTPRGPARRPDPPSRPSGVVQTVSSTQASTTSTVNTTNRETQIDPNIRRSTGPSTTGTNAVQGNATPGNTTLGTSSQPNGCVETPFSDDSEITRGWHRLEEIIEKFVDTVLVQELPADAVAENTDLYEILKPLSSLPAEMVRSRRYARYLFQITIWNLLDKRFFGRATTTWAGEKPNALEDNTSRTRGLAATLARLTYTIGIENEPPRTHDERLEFFRWRNNTVNFITVIANDQDAWEAVVGDVVCDILYTFAGHFKSAFSSGTEQDWDVLVARASFLVAEAGILACKMRQSKDGVWLPFIPKVNRRVDFKLVEIHNQKDVALPPGQTDMDAASSRITMSVVPGLGKFTTSEYMSGPTLSTDPDDLLPTIRHKVRAKAKCFIDLKADDVTASQQEAGASSDGA